MIFRELESQDLAIAEIRGLPLTTDAAELQARENRIAARLEAQRRTYENHLGFSCDVLAYDAERNRYDIVATSPATPQVTTMAIRWGEDFVIPSGEIRPGVRAPAIVRIRLNP